jgi:hypothetical protein
MYLSVWNQYSTKQNLGLSYLCPRGVLFDLAFFRRFILLITLKNLLANTFVNIEHYPFFSNETFLDFEFESDGPNGKIKKVVRYSPQNANGVTYFNLGFGDWNGNTGKIDDSAISNNHDRDRILATVAATVLDFTAHFPDVMVYAKGSTPARTRLYQMGISGNWNEIEPLLIVYGFLNNEWHPFEKNVNYEAFLAVRK